MQKTRSLVVASFIQILSMVNTTTICVSSFIPLCLSCAQPDKSKGRNSGSAKEKSIEGNSFLGRKINFMSHAVTLHNNDSGSTLSSDPVDFKIVTYGDLYCYPCWEAVKKWKEHLKTFQSYRNVSFYCYINAMPSDFDQENEVTGLKFPVFLDVNGRFKTVNKLGNDPRELTFLLNKDNEIILVGPPFSSEMKQKYFDLINQSTR